MCLYCMITWELLHKALMPDVKTAQLVSPSSNSFIICGQNCPHACDPIVTHNEKQEIISVGSKYALSVMYSGPNSIN